MCELRNYDKDYDEGTGREMVAGHELGGGAIMVQQDIFNRFHFFCL